MSNKENIKDFYGRVIGTIITKPNGDKVIKDFYGRVKGTYIKKSNYTKDFYGRVVGEGDTLLHYYGPELLVLQGIFIYNFYIGI